MKPFFLSKYFITWANKVHISFNNMHGSQFNLFVDRKFLTMIAIVFPTLNYYKTLENFHFTLWHCSIFSKTTANNSKWRARRQLNRARHFREWATFLGSQCACCACMGVQKLTIDRLPSVCLFVVWPMRQYRSTAGTYPWNSPGNMQAGTYRCGDKQQ